MKNKHPNAIAVLALGLAMAGLHLADLLLWTDADTGFATAGPPAARQPSLRVCRIPAGRSASAWR